MEIYVLGPGVGESVVVRMPDGRTVVVDCCVDDGTNLPAALLDDLGVDHIDLLVLTHPDLDHVRGMADLVRRFRPARVWRYPRGLLRDTLQVLGGMTTAAGAERFVEARAANDALDELLQTTGTVAHTTSGAVWSPPGAGYRVVALAPTPYDEARAFARARELVERARGRVRLTAQAEAWFSGERPLGDLPNMVSIGLVIELGARRIVLGGDIENGDGTPHSGWRGVLAQLARPDVGLGALMDDVDVVKVAHHGSTGAWSDEAWARHAATRRPVAIIAPYAPSRLPTADVLGRLRAAACRLGITSAEGDGAGRARRAGWADAAARSVPLVETAACVKVTLPREGDATLACGARAAWLA